MDDSVSSNVTPISSQDQGEASRQELLKRLDEASKRAEETRAKREELETQGELERRVLEAEREAADQEALLNAESEHGSSRIATVSTDLGVIILKRANALRFKKFQDLESTKTLDVERLVRPCIVYPDKSRFDVICEELPATLMQCGNAVAILAGARAQENAGKS